MKHKHELLSGRTSTIATHLLGLKDNGNTFVSSHQSEVALKAKHLVTLMDLAGHEKYLKTTIAGLSRGMADYALVLVNSMQSPTHMTRHHLKLCVSMGIPVIVVMTKVSDLGLIYVFTVVHRGAFNTLTRNISALSDRSLPQPCVPNNQTGNTNNAPISRSGSQTFHHTIQ
jgi:GTPase